MSIGRLGVAVGLHSYEPGLEPDREALLYGDLGDGSATAGSDSTRERPVHGLPPWLGWKLQSVLSLPNPGRKSDGAVGQPA